MTAKPDIKTVKRSKDDEYIVNACDGIWDCLTNDECVKKVSQMIKEVKPNQNESDTCAQVLDDILAKDTETGIGTDNMTIILIRIKNS